MIKFLQVKGLINIKPIILELVQKYYDISISGQSDIDELNVLVQDDYYTDIAEWLHEIFRKEIKPQEKDVSLEKEEGTAFP